MTPSVQQCTPVYALQGWRACLAFYTSVVRSRRDIDVYVNVR